MVTHDIHTEENVFFTDETAAQEYLEKVGADPDVSVGLGQWRIEELTEGVKFEAGELYRIRKRVPVDVYGDPDMPVD